MNYTSNSAVGCYQECNRKRYLQYFFDGAGIVPAGRSIPLTTGTCVHKGIEHMARWLKKKGARLVELVKRDSGPIIDEAVEIGKQTYLAELTDKKLYGKGVDTDKEQQYTVEEQLALTEALIRAWGLRELPNLHQRFQIYDVEREIAVPLTKTLELESRCDILLRERLGKDIYCYSLKTIKEFTRWRERGYKDDLQGLLEMYAAEYYLTRENQRIREGVEFLKGYLKGDIIDDMVKLLGQKLVADSPMAVKFCFLVKGKREEVKKNGEPTGRYRTSSSLIRGYRKFSTGGVNYAHSYYYPNAENDSGIGRLGKGWEGFDAWGEGGEKVGGVKGWIEMLDSRVKDHSSDRWMFEIQPECGDIISKYVVTPVESFRDEREIAKTVVQITHQESAVFRLVELTGTKNLDPATWVQSRGHCHYPDECPYIPICYLKEPGTDKPLGSEVREDPIGSGYYERRIPHHERERNQGKSE